MKLVTEALPQVPEQALLSAAEQARLASYSPYSHFAVGAAVLTDDGRLFGGTNVENASFGLTICAERAAVFAAVAARAGRLIGLAVVADPPAAPCGACRQVLWEFWDHSFIDEPSVLIAAPAGAAERRSLASLLPNAFGPENVSTRP